MSELGHRCADVGGNSEVRGPCEPWKKPCEKGQMKLAQGHSEALELRAVRGLSEGGEDSGSSAEDPCPELNVGFYRVNKGESLKHFRGKPIFSPITINFLLKLFRKQVLMMLANNEETLRAFTALGRWMVNGGTTGLPHRVIGG